MKRRVRSPIELYARLREINRENLTAEKRCPGCGCTKRKPCVEDFGADGWNVCIFINGVSRCTACLNGRRFVQAVRRAG